MSQNSEDIKKKVQEKSEKLAELGFTLTKNQFSYKIEEKISKEYWQKRIKNLIKYNEISLEYYTQIQNLMNLVNKEEAQMFLLQTSKFHQLGTELIKLMQQIEENPSIINSKDKQQSQWSKKIKGKIIENSKNCLENEKNMNLNFRKFYDTEIKEILE
ncbi:MAG: hypothetical protein CXT78_07120 [Thaumarchaeota archaeon]|jgi:hypothetical protein|nr:MAG: hypothetical protein CXT78_07120 [Nitrososphaerota archaeon]